MSTPPPDGHQSDGDRSHGRPAEDPSVAADGTGSVATTEKPDRYAFKAIWASAVGYMMDGFDLLILGFALAAITAEFALSDAAAGSLATITLIGAVLGGFVGGILSDYVGRVRVLTFSILIFAVFTALTGLAPNFWLLVVFRFIAGVGLGAEYGVGMTLASEAWPAKWRARATSYVALGWQVGVLLAAVAAAFVIPLVGWRGLFILGAIPAVLAFFTRRHVEEPKLFQGRKKGSAFPLIKLFQGKENVKHSVAIMILTSVQNFGYYGLIIWLPSFLATQYDFGITQSSVWTGVTVIGMMFGIFVFGWCADRFGRKPMFIIFQLGAAVSVVFYSQLTNEYALLIGGAIMGIFVNGMLGGYGALTAELFPTEARGTAQNVLFNVGRGVGGFAPIVVGVLAMQYSFPVAIGLLGGIYVLALLTTVFLVPERRGAELV
ncbi:MAG: MFS transporter [Propionibacteriaceae bacterium]